MVADFPLRVDDVDGAWRARPVGTSPHRDLLDVLAGAQAAPEGFRVTGGEPLVVGDGERRVEVDQTNVSWIVGEAVVVKWDTGPLQGPHPAPERLRRLVAAGFPATPRLRGLVEWETPQGHWVPVVTVTDYLPRTTDGWTWCVDEARLALDLRDGFPVPFAAPLGQLTGAMHRALADGPRGPVADHGDLHVGQVLRTPGGEMFVIDFDGNPTLSPEERVAHRPAAYDVAGLLLSLENVGHVVRRYDPQIADAEVAAWTDGAQASFLEAYRSVAGELLDESLLEPFVLAQIQRELAYADAHLPRWRYVPEAALRRRGLA